MADVPPYPDTGDDTGVRPDRGAAPGTPRWVNVLGIIGLVVVLLVVVYVVAGVFGGSGEHSPDRHAPSGDAGGQTPVRVARSPGD